MSVLSSPTSRLPRAILVELGILCLWIASAHAQPLCSTANITTPLPKAVQINLQHAYTGFIKQTEYLQRDKTMEQNTKAWLAAVHQAIEPYGYFNPIITHHWQPHKACMQSVLHVQLGQPTTITTIHWHITPKKSPISLIGAKEKWPVYPGMVFNTPQFQDAKSTIRHLISEQGYKNVDMSRTTLQIDPEHHHAIIDFNIDLGKRYRFGHITWTHGILSDNLLKRFISVHSGQYFSELTLQQIQTNLQKTGYFSMVKVHYHLNPKGVVPIHFELKAADKAQAIYGLGYDSETKITGIFNIKFNRLNAKGHIFEAQTSISKNKPYINVEYFFPGPQPMRNHYVIQSLFKYNKRTKNREKSAVLTFKYQSKNVHKKSSISLNYLLNRSHPVLGAKTTTHLFYPSLSMSWRNRLMQRLPFITSPIEQQFDLMVLGSTDRLSSSLNLFQLQSHYHAKLPLHPLLRLLVAGHLGFNRTNHPADQPDITKLKLGGSNGLRGYAYNSLMGDPLAKQLKLKAMTLEMQYQLMPSLYLTTFMDAGNIVRAWRDPIKKSAGFGLTYGTPIGDINVSLARPIHERNSTWRINLTYTN